MEQVSLSELYATCEGIMIYDLQRFGKSDLSQARKVGETVVADSFDTAGRYTSIKFTIMSNLRGSTHSSLIGALKKTTSLM